MTTFGETRISEYQPAWCDVCNKRRTSNYVTDARDARDVRRKALCRKCYQAFVKEIYGERASLPIVPCSNTGEKTR